MRYHIYRAMAVLFSLIALIVIFVISNPDTSEEEGFHLAFHVGKEKIEAYHAENQYYLFLPSHAELEKVTLTKASPCFQMDDDSRVITPKDTLTGLPMNEGIACTNMETGEGFTFFIMQSENIPAMYLKTDSGSLDSILESQEYQEKGSFKVITEDGEIDCSSKIKSIHGRGNYSWDNYEKKPFSFATKDEISILNLKKGSNWVLVANASDPTFIRNELVKGMERALEVTYQNEGTFIDLYINGEYHGNYYLCEKVEVGASRVAITDMEAEMDKLYVKQNLEHYPDYEEEGLKAKNLEYNPTDITGGYLLEREFADRYLVEYDKNPSSFITEGKEHFLVKSPKYCSKEQIQYISALVGDAEAAILAKDGCHPETGKSYEEYIDVESFVKKYLVEEVSKNYDAGVSSAYFYKDSDTVSTLLHAGPGWDYDMSFGNYLDWMAYLSENPEGITKLSLHDYASPWYSALLEKEEYLALVKEYYQNAVAPYLNELLEEKIDWWKMELQASAKMDFIRWQQTYEENPYYTNREQSFTDLKDYIQARKDFIDSVWVEDHVYYIVKFMTDGVVSEIRYIEEGQPIGELPMLVVNDKIYSHWQQEGAKRYVTKEDIVKEDMTINGVSY